MIYLVPILFVIIPISIVTVLIACICMECIFRVRSNHISISSHNTVIRRLVKYPQIDKIQFDYLAGQKSIDNGTN